MAGVLGNLPVSVSKIKSVKNANDTFVVLDYMFQKNAIILNDIMQVLTGSPLSLGPLSINSLPLVGFEYMAPEEVELLKYSYSEYPYVNKTMITNAYIKENTKVSVIGLRPITATVGGALDTLNNLSTSVVGNYITNELIVQLLQQYCDKGGTFTLLTMWGQLDNLVLERLSGVKTEAGANQMSGQAYKFEFQRVNFPKSKTGFLKSAISKMSLGIL